MPTSASDAACKTILRKKNIVLLDNKLALVTGAARGLGEAIARGFAAEGARVLVVDRDLEGANKVANAIRAAGGWAEADSVDVADAGAVDALAARVQQTHGDIDVLVNNAGISVRSKFDEPGAREAWDRVMSVNLQGVFNVTQSFVESLKASHGCIVNLSSIVAFGAGISSAPYVASKGAVRSLTQVLARDLAPFGVRVNAIAPGLMVTDMTAGQRETEGGTDWYLNRTPMKRNGEAAEIVGPVVFLASKLASYVNGVVLPVDGGYLAT